MKYPYKKRVFYELFTFAALVGLKDKYVRTVAEIESLHKEVKEQSEVEDILEVTFIHSSSFAFSDLLLLAIRTACSRRCHNGLKVHKIENFEFFVSLGQLCLNINVL